MILSRLPLIALLILGLSIPPLHAAPKVVVSIKPIHSLVAGIMRGVDEPELLIDGSQSPHDFMLKPSAVRRLLSADLLVWVGPGLESPLSHLLEQNPPTGTLITLTRMDGLELLPHRRQAQWHEGAHDGMVKSHDGHHHAGDVDSHIWLSPRISREIVTQITNLLCDMDLANTARYRSNSSLLLERLNRLDRELDSRLAPVRGVPYIVFHDAYHYLEQHYGLNPVASVSIGPERQPGARHIRELRRKIQDLKARCVFSEPQFQPKLVAALTEGSGAGTGQLDPLGSDLDAGPEAYFQLMQRLADSLLDCLM